MPSAIQKEHAESAIQSPFGRLAALLEGIEPGLPAIDLSVGGPRHPYPDFLLPKLAENEAGFGHYPAIRGTDELRGAIADWLGRRYPPLAGIVDPETDILPLCGTREGLFYTVFPAIRRRPDIERPAVLVPNPFYQTYAAAALAAGAEPVYLAADASTDFLPDIDRIDDALARRTVAMFLCSPSNPQGAVADRAYLHGVVEFAKTHDFMLFADECYSEIHTGEPPPGALETGQFLHGDFRNVVSFQSLSKRSNLPGLRSGFCAGDSAFLDALALLRNVAGPQLPLPVQHASAAIWRDEAHVEANRALYTEKFDLADRLLAGRFGYQRPSGGFFLWLDMSRRGGGEAATKTLWKECGVKILPGAYLAQTGSDGSNPGADFVRVALVADRADTEEALTRIVGQLG